jgi:hypothetical protein
MCEFFSFLSDGKGSYIYADAKTRKDNPGEKHDSHTWLAQHFLGEGASKLEDLYNKYEYNPFTRTLRLDNRGQECEDDFDSAEKWCREIDFNRIVPELIIKNLKNPLTGKPKKVTQKDIENLKKWISVCDSVRSNILKKFKIHIYNKVSDSIWINNCNKFGIRSGVIVNNIINTIVMEILHNRAVDNIGSIVSVSIWNSIWNYVASFFDIKYDFDITPGNELWNRGFVPSFDGTTWRLHSGKAAKIVYEMKA